GIVVVGDLVGQGSAQEQAVVGDTPNLAARLQALAEPGAVLIAEATKRLLGRTFELKSLGPRVVKGFGAEVIAWAVLRDAENVSRFDASHSLGMTPFVGREHEVAMLLDRWRNATDGEGQVALLSGEAGIGKSRILAALRERISDEPHIAIRYQCSPHHINDAFYPLTSHIRQAARFVDGESPGAKLDKLEALIARSASDATDIAPVLASLLLIPFEGRYPPLEMAPSEQKERTIAALNALFERLTKDAPVLALLEDAHWIDPTSLDAFGRLIDRIPSLRALLLITFRPEFLAPWVGRAHVASLQLSRFGRRQAIAMVERVAGGKGLAPEVLEQIVAKTDGVPLFLEELTKTVLESGLLREVAGTYALASALTPLAIPSTLQDALMARLDRLAPVKEIAQIGAAIGREFSYRLLEAVSPIKGPTLQSALGQLMAAELIHERGSPPEATYVFKHALVQDTAYASLLRSRRARLHADIARALEQRSANQSDAAPATIAHHYSEAGLAEPAARYWLAAAELALSRSAQTEAERYVDAGLAQVSRLADGSDRQSLELSLQIARANVLMLLKGYAAAETLAALTEAKRLLDGGFGSDLQRFTVLNGLCSANHQAARLDPALALAREIIEVANREKDTTYLMIGYRLQGVMLYYMGRNREALKSFAHAERYRDPVRHRPLSYRFGVDPGLDILAFKTLALLQLGLIGQADRVREEIRAELATHGHAPTVATFTFLSDMVAEDLLGNHLACERIGSALAAYCAEHQLEQIRTIVAEYRTCTRAILEPTIENIRVWRSAHEVILGFGGMCDESEYGAQLAEILLSAGDSVGAETALREAFAFVEQSGELYWLAELHRVDGQIALRRGPDRARAETCFQRAIDVARGQEARLLELRAAIDLARLWRDAGSAHDPRALLQSILAEIEGEGTRDVRNARALLAEIE
ncbi:MAG TPA: AAA family ATPase, partial [Roseiarcus sp.]